MLPTRTVGRNTLGQESSDDLAMGFNKRKIEDQRRQAAEKEAAARRATEKQILENADHLIALWRAKPSGFLARPAHNRCRSSNAARH
jgi:hypothetical protein